jgi:archaeal chaperonin
MDPIDTMAELRVKQNKGAKWTGVDVRNTKVTDMFKQDVLEPLVVKEQIIKSATEVATMLLKIDDVIAGNKSKMPPGPPGGGGGGMGGIGGGYGSGMDME